MTNTLKHFRAKTHKSGRTYYYFDAGKGTKIVPLGADYVLAVNKWKELSGIVMVNAGTFDALAVRYEAEHLPSLAKTTQSTNKSDLKQLKDFFKGAPLDQIKPTHIAQLVAWKKTTPTTANRLKRLFSAMFNLARAWGYTDAQNPAEGIRGLTVKVVQRDINDDVFAAIHEAASQPLKDAMDLAYLTGQRPADTLKMTERDITNGVLSVTQNKTDADLSIQVVGALEVLIQRIKDRKAGHKVVCLNLVVAANGRAMTPQMLRKAIAKAKTKATIQHPDVASGIAKFWFTKLRSKAATDIAKTRSLQDAADLLGHTETKTTRKHYIAKQAKHAMPTK